MVVRDHDVGHVLRRRPDLTQRIEDRPGVAHEPRVDHDGRPAVQHDAHRRAHPVLVVAKVTGHQHMELRHRTLPLERRDRVTS